MWPPVEPLLGPLQRLVLIMSDSTFLCIPVRCLDTLAHSQATDAHSKIRASIRDALQDAVGMMRTDLLQATRTHYITL